MKTIFIFLSLFLLFFVHNSDELTDSDVQERNKIIFDNPFAQSLTDFESQHQRIKKRVKRDSLSSRLAKVLNDITDDELNGLSLDEVKQIKKDVLDVVDHKLNQTENIKQNNKGKAGIDEGTKDSKQKNIKKKFMWNRMDKTVDDTTTATKGDETETTKMSENGMETTKMSENGMETTKMSENEVETTKMPEDRMKTTKITDDYNPVLPGDEDNHGDNDYNYDYKPDGITNIDENFETTLKSDHVTTTEKIHSTTSKTKKGPNKTTTEDPMNKVPTKDMVPAKKNDTNADVKHGLFSNLATSGKISFFAIIIQGALITAINIVSIIICCKMRDRCGGLADKKQKDSSKSKSSKKSTSSKKKSGKKGKSKSSYETITQKQRRMKEAAGPSTRTTYSRSKRSKSKRKSKKDRKDAGSDIPSYDLSMPTGFTKYSNISLGSWTSKPDSTIVDFSSIMDTDEYNNYDIPLDFYDMFNFGQYYSQTTLNDDDDLYTSTTVSDYNANDYDSDESDTVYSKSHLYSTVDSSSLDEITL